MSLPITGLSSPSSSSLRRSKGTNMASRKQTDINTEKKGPDKNTIESGFVIYDPDNPPFERLHLCKYLLELPDLEEEDDS